MGVITQVFKKIHPPKFTCSLSHDSSPLHARIHTHNSNLYLPSILLVFGSTLIDRRRPTASDPEDLLIFFHLSHTVFVRSSSLYHTNTKNTHTLTLLPRTYSPSAFYYQQRFFKRCRKVCTREKSGRPTTGQSRCAAPFAPCLRVPTTPVRSATAILSLLITPSRICRRIPHNINIRHTTKSKRDRSREIEQIRHADNSDDPILYYDSRARTKHLMMTRPTPPESTQKIIQPCTQ